MIVTCERCDTEFQLDDTRVPEGGARVRCSRCKHAFFVVPPAASPEAEIDRAASRALDDDPTPDVTADLPDVAAEAAERAASAGAADEGESDWEFNADLPVDAGDSSTDLFGSRDAEGNAVEPASLPLEAADTSPDLATRAVERPARAAEPVRRSEPVSAAEPDADLGTPLNWDFFDEDDRPAPATLSPPRTGAPAPELAVARAPEPVASREPSRVLRFATEGAGWLATAGLCAIVLLRGLASPAPAAIAWPEPAPGIALEQVNARWLDNLSLGRLYVVSGRVHNAAAMAASLPPLVLELRDDAGRAVGHPIPLRAPLTADALREGDAAALAAAGSERPGGLAAGVSWDFQAVAWPLPAEATRFAIRVAKD